MFAPLLPQFVQLPRYMRDGDNLNILTLLNDMSKVFEEMSSLMIQIPQLVDQFDFYNTYR